MQNSYTYHLILSVKHIQIYDLLSKIQLFPYELFSWYPQVKVANIIKNRGSSIVNIMFLGTRGGIKARSQRHHRHTSTLILYRGKNVMIDCGLDWLGQIFRLNPEAIIITHAHPDHVNGLKNGTPCPVYATQESWDIMRNFDIHESQKNIITIGKPILINKILFEAFELEHSLIAPAVGYKITAGKSTIFYASDLVAIQHKAQALEDCKLYIGDGAIIARSLLVRTRDHTHIGHTSIKEQLAWCKQAEVPRAIFTHCGTEIVTESHDVIEKKITHLGHENGVQARIAFDGYILQV